MQWRVVLGIIFALVVAVFAVFNGHSEPINYVFGVSYIPLVLIILGAALLGALAVAIIGVVGRFKLAAENRGLRRTLSDIQEKLDALAPKEASSSEQSRELSHGPSGEPTHGPTDGPSGEPTHGLSHGPSGEPSQDQVHHPARDEDAPADDPGSARRTRLFGTRLTKPTDDELH